MQNLRLIKGRIKSAKNISQITKAMELVSASKMRKAQVAAQSGKLYAEMIREMVMKLGGGSVDSSAHPLLKKPKTLTGKRLVILISTNKGMCGGLNSSLFRFVLTTYPTMTSQEWVTVGGKGAVFVSTMKGHVLADFSHAASFSMFVPAIADLATKAFLSGDVDGVDLVYNQFISVIRQQPRVKAILPLTVEGLGNEGAEHISEPGNFLVEPSPDEVFASLLPSYIENQIRDAILQAEASEHAARMVAMRNATDNAKAFISELTLIYNKVRQEKITTEIADLVTARAAIVTD